MWIYLILHIFLKNLNKNSRVIINQLLYSNIKSVIIIKINKSNYLIYNVLLLLKKIRRPSVLSTNILEGQVTKGMKKVKKRKRKKNYPLFSKSDHTTGSI